MSLRALQTALAGLLVAASTTQAQNLSEPAPPWPQIHAELGSWRALHGDTWTLRADEQTGYGRFLFNGNVAAPFELETEADWLTLALAHLEAARPMLGIETETLVDGRVLLLPLGQVGTSDKMTVGFGQTLNGVPVRGGSASALFLLDGTLISLDTTGMPNVLSLSTDPTRDAGDATTQAIDEFTRATGLRPTFVGEPTLLIEQEVAGKLRVPTLAWEVEVLWRGTDAEPEGTRYRVAATGAARVVSSEPMIHHVDVGGFVTTNATPGTKPDLTTNPPTPVPAAYMNVTSSAGTVQTDQNGFFNFVGATGPLQCTFTYKGTYNNVTNQSGAPYSLVTTLATGTSNSVLLNPSPTQQVTAQSNSFTHVNILRDWTRSINPSDAMADFVAKADCNISSTCNAYYDGSSINFYLAGGGCVNTSYSTVIAHEWGHWMNDRYSSGNGSDGFGEGNADVFAMYVYDTPIVGENFAGGSFIRTGTNTRQYCGDGNPGCYGQVHADGEVLMGALWKVREQLNNSLGDALGDALADYLFNAWMNAYNDGRIDSIIEEHWLTLDDDDGIIENGTPHHAEIDAGFVAQGFPGYQLSFVTFASLVGPSDTQDEAGPYGVAADLTPVFGTSVASAAVHYSVNGGSYTTVPMNPASGATWIAMLPGIASPSRVDYYYTGVDDLGNSDSWPKDAPTSVLSFKIGVSNTFFFDDFETTDDNGWTSQQFQTQNDWHHEASNGKAGSSSGVSWADPPVAYSGLQLWGNDLGRTGWNGSYKPNVWNELTSPVIDTSSAVGTTLEFQRWLTVEKAQYDQATILVNGSVAWQNDFSTHHLDTSWNLHSLDISALADGVATTQIVFRMQSDGGLELGGWNIDDLEVLTFDPTPAACQPFAYGSGTPGTLGTPVLDSAGQESQKGNAGFEVKIKDGLAGASAFLGMGFSQASVPALGGTLLIFPSLVWPVSLDIFGQASIAVPIADDAGLVGLDAFFQAFVIDGGAPGGFAMTPGLQATICL
jgi:hypothetical protein